VDLTLLTDWLWILGLLGLGVTFVIWSQLRKLPPGNEVMRGLAAQIESGAMAFARRVAVVMGGFVVVAGALLFLVAGYRTAGAFAGGAACAMAAAFSGLFAAVRANVRTAEAARYPGLPAALRTGFAGGAVAGMAVASLAVLGAGLLYFLGIGRPDVVEEIRFREFAEIVSGFAMGASSIALFARVGGGIFTKAADMGADLVGKVEADIPEDDPRNPATIADLAGDCAGGTAGMGADLFESCAAAVIAAIAVGMTERTLTGCPCSPSRRGSSPRLRGCSCCAFSSRSAPPRPCGPCSWRPPRSFSSSRSSSSSSSASTWRTRGRGACTTTWGRSWRCWRGRSRGCWWAR
jgi:K(+)-stimulated pyrophosphate-energized sodium pump